MNDTLREFLGVAPGLIAGIKNPAFGAQMMEGFERARRLDEQQRRLKQQDQLALQDRQTAAQDHQRAIERQKLMDQRAEQDRAAADQQRLLSLSKMLSEVGGTAETLPQAEGAIESTFGLLTPEQQAKLTPTRDQALRGAATKVNSRQKGELKRWVTDELLKSEMVAKHGDVDFEITQAMPARIRQIAESMTGQATFKKSDLLALTESLEPQRKPSEDVSLQRDVMLVNGVPTAVTFNPKTSEWKDQTGNVVRVTPPPRPTGGDGGLSANQTANLTEKLAKSWNDVNASGREMRRQYGLMQTGLRRFREGDKNGGSQAVLVTFQKILDPSSVVRESEYARSAQGISMLGRIQGYIDRLEAGGAGVPDAELAGMVETARQMIDDMASYSTGQRSRIEAMAREYKINPVLIFGLEPAQSGGATALPSDSLPPMAPVSTRDTSRTPGARPLTTGGPTKGERRRFGDVLGEWNGKEWVEVKF